MAGETDDSAFVVGGASNGAPAALRPPPPFPSSSSSALRKPCFATGRGGVAGEGSVGAYARSVVVRRNVLAADDDDDDDDASSPCRDDDEEEGGDRVATGGGAAGSSSPSTGRKKEEPSMERCVSLLEPHLAAFRARCLSASASVAAADDDEAKRSDSAAALAKEDGGEESLRPSSEGEHKDEDDDGRREGSNEEVPPQLLRVARFFGWRWTPMRRALLRPAPSSSDEIEVGSAYRLRLARALHARGLLAAAEVDGLAASFANRRRHQRLRRHRRSVGPFSVSSSTRPDDGRGAVAERDVDDCEGASRKRRWQEEELDLRDRVELSLGRLPLDASLPRGAARQALRHARTVLSEYCLRIRDTDEKVEEEGEIEGSRTSLPPADDVADRALTAFVGIVATNGIDDDGDNGRRSGSDDKGRSIEASVATMLCDFSSSDGDTRELTNAVQCRLSGLLSPPAIDRLSGLHLLSLGRLLSHLERRVAVDLLGLAVARCSDAGGGAGLSSLPKLLACYLSLSPSDDDGPNGGTGPSRVASFEASVKRTIETAKNAAALETGRRGRDETVRREKDRSDLERFEVEGRLEFLDIVLRAAVHLLSRRERRSTKCSGGASKH